MVKFPFNILAPIPKLIQVFLSLFYSGSNPPVMLIGCTQELISNRLFRHAQIRLAELQNSSCMLSPLIVVSPCVWLSSASQPHTPHPAHTGSCSSLPPQHSPLWPAAATNSQLCFSWLLAARELTREPQCSKWCDKKELCRTVFSNFEWLKWLEETLELFLSVCLKVNIKAVIKFSKSSQNCVKIYQLFQSHPLHACMMSW